GLDNVGRDRRFQPGRSCVAVARRTFRFAVAQTSTPSFMVQCTNLFRSVFRSDQPDDVRRTIAGAGSGAVGGPHCDLAAGQRILEVDAAEPGLSPYNRMTCQQSTVTPEGLSQPQACFFDRSSSFIYSAGDECEVG